MKSVNNSITEIRTEEDLEEELSRPYSQDIEFASKLEGDVLILGAGGKMGPTLARRISEAFKKAGKPNKTYAVSRFSDNYQYEHLASLGINVIKADLLNERQLNSLPNSPNILFLVGTKFGTVGNESRTWATNSFLPGKIAERFPDSRICCLSTGNLYPPVSNTLGGSLETDTPSPKGEYALSCLGRERILEYFSRYYGTAVTMLRLNYSVEPRYGVLLDIGKWVLGQKSIPLEMGYFNVIWQGDANSYAFRSLGIAKSPPQILNITGPETVSVRKVACDFGKRFGVDIRFHGKEKSTSFLSNAKLCYKLLGPPKVKLSQLIDLTSNWIIQAGITLQKPTNFQIRDGGF